MARSHCRILVVEDDADARMLLSDVLAAEGYEVGQAEDGPHAVESLKAASYDLVLTDVRMPGMEGIDLLRRIRQAWPALPVVLMTAFGDWDLYEEALREGAKDVIGKPFRQAELIRLLEHCLESADVKSPGAGRKGQEMVP